MAVYTIRIGSIDRLFNAEDITDAKKIAKSKGWNPENIVAGDWIRYPETGYPRLGTLEREAYTEPVIDIDYSRASIPGELPPPTGKERFGATEAPPSAPTTTTGGAATEYPDWSHLATFKERLEQQIEAYNKSEGTSFSIDKAGITEYLDKIGANERTRTSILNNYDTATQLESSYQDYLTKYQAMGTPKAKDFAHFLANYEQWYTEYTAGLTEAERARVREFETWLDYSRKYGEIDEQYPVDIDDFYDNYDKYQQQLVNWKQQAAEKEVEYTADQVRDFNNYKSYASQFRELGDWLPVDIEDYFANYDQAQQQLGGWQRQGAEVERYEVPPEEALRRQEEAYRESRYAAEERYREQPRYSEPFAGWLGEQGQLSGALEQYVEREYPSLRTEYQAGLPRLTGFPTREEARAEATRRESGFAPWLSERLPETRQEYWGQRPAERGERLWMQAPGLRGINW